MIPARWHRLLGTAAFVGLGCLALVIGVVTARQAAATTGTLSRDVAVARGWVQALPSLESARQHWDPHHRSDEPSAPATWVADRLQQVLAQSGVQVLSLQPEPDQRPESSAPAAALTVAVLGTSSQIAALLQALPQWLPGATLERVELGTQEHGIEGRLRVTVPQPGATLASALAVSDVAWRTPPPAFPSVQLDRLVPPAPAVNVAGPAPLAAGADAPRLTLQGIVFSQTPRAYVLDERTHQTVTVRPGDTLGPLTIKAIRERTVLIEQEGSTYELRV